MRQTRKAVHLHALRQKSLHRMLHTEQGHMQKLHGRENRKTAEHV
jgi:hypothetical protein